MSGEALAVIGGGNMARAILGGGRGGPLRGVSIVVAEPDESKHAGLRALGAEVERGARAALARLGKLESSAGAGRVLLAVKPQMLGAVASDVRDELAARPRAVISILAGVPSSKVRAALGGAVPVVRAMPNLPAQIGCGVTAVCAGEGARAGDLEAAERMFAGVGPVVVRIEERLMDAFTALAGSGPAYVFYLAEAMVNAGVAMGFERGLALRLAGETIAGAGALLAASGQEPGELRSAVTSRGGTTAAATAVLDEAGVMGVVERAILAARDRGAELARLA